MGGIRKPDMDARRAVTRWRLSLAAGAACFVFAWLLGCRGYDLFVRVSSAAGGVLLVHYGYVDGIKARSILVDSTERTGTAAQIYGFVAVLAGLVLLALTIFLPIGSIR